MWTLAFGHHEDRTPTHGLQVWRHVEEAVCRASELNKSTKTPAVRKRPDFFQGTAKRIRAGVVAAKASTPRANRRLGRRPENAGVTGKGNCAAAARGRGAYIAPPHFRRADVNEGAKGPHLIFGLRTQPRIPGPLRQRCSGDFLPPSPPTERAPAKLWRAILQSASQLASLLDSRSGMPFARLFPFGVIEEQGSGASFSEISSHALLG
jgi:hypothetical protein